MQSGKASDRGETGSAKEGDPGVGTEFAWEVGCRRTLLKRQQEFEAGVGKERAWV